MSQMEGLLGKYVHIFVVVSAYWVVSMLTVFVNKALLSELKLEAPIFITFFQTIISTIICFLMKTFSKSFPESKPFDAQTIKDVFPLTFMFTAMIVTNNLCLKYVSVAFYYIGRSLTTIFNVAFTYMILGEKTSGKCIFFCAMIIFGFYLGVDQENIAGSLSTTGTIFGILGSLSLSLYSIVTKKVLPKVNQEIWLLSYYNNLYSTVIFIPLIIFNNEINEIMQYPRLYDYTFWLAMTLGGICGFSIGFLTSLQIKVTSALTHNISGTAKACAQTVLATYWYEEVKSLLWWTSNFIVLISSAGYARVKQIDMEKKHKASPAYTKV